MSGEGGLNQETGNDENEVPIVNSKYDEDDDNVDLSEEEADADGDASGEKNRQRREQHASYEAPDQDEVQIEKDMVESGESGSEDEGSRPEEHEDQQEEIVGDALEKPPETNPDHSRRVNNVLLCSTNIARYHFDQDHQEWCEVELRFPVTGSKVMLTTVIEKLACQSIIYEIPGVTRSFLIENKDKPSMFKTEGVNLKTMWCYPEVLDIEKLYTNDTHLVANTYGIEAAGRVIAREIKNVFGAYGIEVDPRHLTLVADYMTYGGSIQAFNRIGMESSASPFQKMSFETTMHFLRGATISGAGEFLASPSSRLVVGQVVRGGTGCFNLSPPLC